MSKRAGGDHLSREQFEDGRSEEREFAPVDISERATESVMSQRKVFVPKSRLPGGRASKPFTFGASAVANSSAPSQSTNVFGGFKSNAAPVNPFQSSATNAPAKPANQPALGAINTNTNNTTSREFLHFKALNNKFLRKLEEFSKSAENGSDWSHLCEMYLDFAKRARARAREENNQGPASSNVVLEPNSFRIPSTQAQAQPSHLNSSTPVNPLAKGENGNDADIIDVSIADESADNSSKMTDSPQVSKAPKPTTVSTGFKFDGIPEGPPSFIFGGKTVKPKGIGHKASASVGGFIYQPGGAGKLMLDNDDSEKATEKSNPSVPEVKSANTSLANGPAFSFGANDPSPVKQGTGSLNFTFTSPAEAAVKPEQPDLRPSGPTQPAGFKFGQQEQQSGSQAPIAKPAAAPKKIPEFSFGQPAATTKGTSATAFTFGASAAVPKTESSAPSDDKKPAFSFSTNSAAPAPSSKPAGTGFMFGASASSQPAAASSGFTFGSNSTETKSEDKPQPKPFTFGSSIPAPASVSAPSQAPKPAFTFGSGLEPAKPAEKLAFSFGTTTSSSKPVTTETATTKPAFTFGSTSTGTGSAFGGSGFSFGKKTDEVSQAMPKFGFQSDSKADAPKFTFGDSAAGAAGSSLFSAKPATEAKDDDEDAEAQADPQIDDLTQQGPGEENEEAVYEKRAKVLELKDGAFETLGVGSLRVLVDKDSKKSRVIIRADGSGRVVINVALRSALSYTVEQKNCVRALDFGSGGEKPRVYFLRVKTGEDAEALAKELERVKS